MTSTSKAVDDAIARRAALLRECHYLLGLVSERPYGLSLLTKVKAMLLACLEYKANRERGSGR